MSDEAQGARPKILSRPIPRMALTWMIALAVYFGVRYAEAHDIHRSLPRDGATEEARADQLAAHVTRSVARARDAERARVASLCESIAQEPTEERMTARLPGVMRGSAIVNLTVLAETPMGVTTSAHLSSRPPTAWDDVSAHLPRAPSPGRTAGIDEGLASELPPSGELATIRIACRAASPSGRDRVVIADLDVVELARAALPEHLGEVTMETEASRAPGTRRWLGPTSGSAPRPALRVRASTPPPVRLPFPFAPVVAALACALAVFFALRPRAPGHALGTLEAAAERIGRGDLEVTLSPEGGAADGTFTAFNRMTRDLKDARARLVRAERVAAWRDVARRIAHEIKNPLTPIRMAIETLRKAKQRQHPDLDDIFEESTSAVLEEVGRMERIVSEFSRFARMPRPKAVPLDVREVAEHVVQVHRLPAEVTQPAGDAAAEVTLEVQGAPEPVRADREQLIQVLTNLVQNAIDAAKSKTPEHPRVLVVLAPAETGVRLEVHDNGPGIHADEATKVLEPYYTTKEKGTGLGLSIVDRIVADHGGTLSIGESATLGGACFTIVLRREGPPEEASSSRPSQP